MFSNLHHVHFLGICGTAMGAVAAALRDQGYSVTGSDEDIYPPMSTFLEEKGIVLCKGYRPENIPAEAELIVVGNAIRRGNPEVEEVLNRKLPYSSLPEVLKFFFLRGRHNLVITGTHGKTTTTSLTAWLLQSAGLAPGYMIGGLPNNFGQGAQFGASPYYVIEGDEYDTAFFDKRSKFVHYLPELLVINNVEFDHADIFNSLDDIKLSFRRLVNIVPSNGMILLNADDPNCLDVTAATLARKLPIGLGEAASPEGKIADVRYEGNASHFTLGGEAFTLPMTGEFNVRNACMAIAAARFYGVDLEKIRTGLASFTGVRRRQEVRGEAGGVKIIDDFGHHPTAIRQTLRGIRQQYLTKGGRLWALFEPRSNTTRRAVFQSQLGAAFADADGVVLARVAKLEQIPEAERLKPERVVEDIRAQGRQAFYENSTEEIVARTRGLAQPGDVVVVFSNGGFDGIHGKLLTALAAG